MHCSYNVTSFLSRFNRKRRAAASALTRFSHRFIAVIMPTGAILDALAVACSLTCLVAMLLMVGFDHRMADLRLLRRVISGCQIILLVNIICHLVFKGVYRRPRTFLLWFVDVAMLITALPLIYPRPQHPWIPFLEQFLYSRKFIYSVISAYSVVQLSYAVMRLPRKRTNPSLMLSSSFILFILIGAMVLMLPKCTYNGIGFVDSLFVSTSAVCITGLCPVDVPSTFTPLGQIALVMMMEIGALGVMTFTSFFAIFFTGNTSIFSQLVIRDVIYSKSMSSLIPTLFYILSVTLAIQLMGTVALFLSLPDTLGFDFNQKLSVAVFHSVSAFCNAGFSNLPGGLGNSEFMKQTSQGVYWVVSIIVVAGAIGFPILVNFKEALRQMFFNIRASFRRGRYFATYRKQVHLFDMNTKIVLTTFFILFFAGAVMFFFMEADNTLYGMTLWERVSQSVFNSVTPRSAGFSSVNPADFLNSTLVVVLFLMWVGGAAQSTAGGVKVNTLAAICLNLRSIITGKPRVTAYHRTVALVSIRRANSVVALSIFCYVVLSVLMLVFEPHLPARAVLFEACSALFTVGSSLGITSQLAIPSKILLCVAMFIGRVGIISMLSGVAGSDSRQPHYPTGDIIIN